MIIQAAIRRQVRNALQKVAVLPKFRPVYVSPLGNMRLFPAQSPLGWSADMIHSDLNVTVARCLGVKIDPQLVKLKSMSQSLDNLSRCVFLFFPSSRIFAEMPSAPPALGLATVRSGLCCVPTTYLLRHKSGDFRF